MFNHIIQGASSTLNSLFMESVWQSLQCDPWTQSSSLQRQSSQPMTRHMLNILGMRYIQLSPKAFVVKTSRSWTRFGWSILFQSSMSDMHLVFTRRNPAETHRQVSSRLGRNKPKATAN